MAAKKGWEKIRWAGAHMPLHAEIKKRFEKERPFSGRRIGTALHLEAKTANLILTLHAGGAELFVIGSNPLSTQDAVAQALAEVEGITVAARHGEPEEERRGNIDRLIDFSPHLIVEDGGDVAWRLHEREGSCPKLIGICEETTTGVERLRTLEREGRLRVPAIAVNDAKMKHLFDNRYGTGQSTWDAIMRATNLLVAGKTVLIVGYGWCGKGLALRAKGLGARVLVCEIDPVKAVEAAMEGCEVVELREGMARADFVITATGRPGVIGEEELKVAKHGQVLANAGHFGYEIDREALGRLAKKRYQARAGVEAYVLPHGRTVYLLGEGELVNLALGDGHPVEIMDVSFALQALSAEYLLQNGESLSPGVYPVPERIDETVARLFLSVLS
ncbi:adenosylhomocysteinase [Candidatus Bipolaricaulota bacterium]|nr:adenosylhomocysteinase [Candidatus Bipolaricaulota bacterium]